MIPVSAQSTASMSDEPGRRAHDTQRRGIRPAEIAQRFWSEFGKPPPRERNAPGRRVGGETRANILEADETGSDEAQLIELPQYAGPITEQRISFHPLQEWEGYVIAVNGETFTARLTDLTKGAQVAEEEAEFPTDDLDVEDRQFLEVGRVFRWAVGYQYSGGTKMRVSHIVFRRLRWTERDLATAEEEGRELAAKIRWE